MTTSQVKQRALEVFAQTSLAHEWLNSSLVALEFKTPLEVCNSKAGKKQVLTLLERIWAGTF